MSRLYNLARMSTATTGTGTITLGSAVSGFLSFSGAGIQDGDTVTYAIQDGSNSEIGRGVYTASGTTLTRTVLRSTNSNSAISLGGTAQVFITPSAEDFLTPVNAQTGTTYTVVSDDIGRLVTLSNASAIAVTLPQAAGRFGSSWFTTLSNIGAGAVTITPTTSTIGGAASYVLLTGQSVKIVSDGTNWLTGFGLGANVRFANSTGVLDSNGNEVLLFGTTASAVNEFRATNAATGGKPVFAATGGDTNIILQIQGKGTGGVEIEGTATNDSAAAGYVGQYVESTVALASAVTMTTATSTDITTISLTAGDWDVEANAEMNNAGGPTVTTMLAWVGTVSATLPTGLGTEGGFVQWRGSTASNVGTSTGNRRISISSTTTIYLTCQPVFSGGTNCKIYGLLRARRVR